MPDAHSKRTNTKVQNSMNLESSELILTPSDYTLSKFDRLAQVRREIMEKTALEDDAVSFSPRAMVYCGLPYKKPMVQQADGTKTPAMLYERKFSRVYMRIGTLAPEVGLPYGGMARLILSYITQAAVRRGVRTICLADNIGDMLRQFGIDKVTGGSRGTITTLRNQLIRLRYSTFLVRWAEAGGAFPDGTIAPPDMYSERDTIFPIISDASLWRKGNTSDILGLEDETKFFLEISEDFFNEICNRPIPIDMRAYRELLSSPMAMDVYVYLSYLSSYVKKPFELPWEVLRDQFRPGIARMARFKADFTDALKDVAMVYPKLKMELDDKGGLIIKPGSAPSVPRPSVAPALSAGPAPKPVKTKTEKAKKAKEAKAKNPPVAEK